MMDVKIVGVAEAEIISQLAYEIWPKTYADIVNAEQIQFMVEKSYTVESLQAQMLEGHVFFILENDGIASGFASVAPEMGDSYKIQKLYIHQNIQKKGAGKLLIEFIEDYCKTKGAEQLLLNVNRKNSAKLFYEKMGYSVLHSVDIPYYDFVLNDYIMGKTL